MSITIRQFTVDAFTDKVFKGNPASICLLDNWLDDKTLLNIAKENNLSETAFIVAKGNEFELRWFTPKVEIDLCGHATLASAFVLYQVLDNSPNPIVFNTLSGKLKVEKQDDLFLMDFPTYELKAQNNIKEVGEILGMMPKEVYLGRDLLCVFDDENLIKNYQADDEQIAKLDGVLCHITAKGADFDCVSRTFAIKTGISEDPVCGSGHCHILPYWAKVLNKNTLTAYQASSRSGILYGDIKGERMILGGQAVLFAKSEIYI